MGLMDIAFDFIKKKGGITTESIYLYKFDDGTCDVTKMNSPAVSIDGHEDVPAKDADALFKAVENQPVSVAIDAGFVSRRRHNPEPDPTFILSQGWTLNEIIAALISRTFIK